MIRTRLATALAALFVVVLSGTAHASLLTITVTPNPVLGTAGDELDLLYEIFNGAQLTPATLVSVTPQMDPAIGELDTFTGDAFDVVLAPQATTTGTIGTFRFAAGATGGAPLALVFSFLSGTTTAPGGEFVETVTIPVEVVVAPPVPEPTSLALLGFGVAGALGARRRRQRA